MKTIPLSPPTTSISNNQSLPVMKLKIKSYCLIASISLSLPAFAAPFAFTDGDLILGFQAANGDGSSQNVFFNLGSGTGYRNNGSQGVRGNIGATLSTTFGEDWYTRTNLYFGVVGNLRSLGLPFSPNPPVDGDPNSTFYISKPAATPGAGFLYPANSFVPASLQSSSTKLGGMESMVVTLTAEADGSAVLDQSTQTVQWENGWTKWNPFIAQPVEPGQGAAFDLFNGGLQQNFGKGGSATYVDVQRILPTNTGAVPTGVVGGGTYETTISISPTGVITSLSAAPASAFDTFIAQFPTITAPADKLTTADPDGDGATNLEEFGFGGNPANGSDSGVGQIFTLDSNNDTQRDITMTLEVRSGASFSVSGNDLVSQIVDEVVYRIEGSTDLLNWDSAVSEVAPPLGVGSPSTGYVFKSFRLNAGNGLVGKGFLRASVTK